MDCVLKECLIHAKLQRCTQLEMLPYCKTPGCFQCLRSSRWFQQKSEIHELSDSWHLAVGRVKSICNTSVWLQEATRSSTDWQWSNGLRRLGMQTTHTSAKLLSPSIIYSREHDYDGFDDFRYEADNFPVWIVSDCRRETDLRYFSEQFGHRVKRIRIVADDKVRAERWEKEN